MGTAVAVGLFLAQGMTLDATAFEAVEGGPVIVDVSLRWDGPPVRHWACSDPAATLSVRLPDEVPHVRRWKEPVLHFGGVVVIGDGSADAFPLLTPGGCYTKRVRVNGDFVAAYPAGDLPLVLRCDLPLKGRVVRVEKRVTVRLRPFTPEYAARVHAEVEEDLRVKGPAYRENAQWDDLIRHLNGRVLDTTHPEYARTAFLLVSYQSQYWCDTRLKDLMWLFPGEAARAHDWYLDYLESDRSRGLEWAFRDFGGGRSPLGVWRLTREALRQTARWDQLLATGLAGDTTDLLQQTTALRVGLRHVNRQLSDDRLARLTRIDNLWVRAFTSMYLSTRLDPAWRGRVLDDLKARYAPLPAGELRALLAGLSDDQVQTQRDAAAALRRNAYRVRPELLAALEAARTPEARNRLAEILTPRPPTADERAEAEFLGMLECYPGRTTSEALEVIAAGHEGVAAVARATAILERRRAGHP